MSRWWLGAGKGVYGLQSNTATDGETGLHADHLVFGCRAADRGARKGIGDAQVFPCAILQ